MGYDIFNDTARNEEAFKAATRFLPAITGAGDTSFRPGQLISSPAVLAALKWIRAFQNSEMAGVVDVRALDVASQTALLVTTEQGNEVSFAYSEYDSQFARWRRVHDWGTRRQQTIASLDLAVANYVPAVWASQTNSVPSTVRPPSPSPYRKKHV